MVFQESSLLQAKQAQLLHLLFVGVTPSLCSALLPSYGPTPSAAPLFCVGNSSLGCSTPDGASEGQSGGEQSHATGRLSFDVAQNSFGLPGCNTHCWLTASFSSARTPKSFSIGLLSASSPSLYRYCWLPQPECNTLHLALLNLVRFTWAYFKLVQSLWMTSFLSAMSTAPLRLALSTNMLRVHLIPLSRSLIKRLKSSHPKTNPRGGLQGPSSECMGQCIFTEVPIQIMFTLNKTGFFKKTMFN